MQRFGGPAGYVGPEIDDRELFERLPSALRSLLSRRNGFVSRSGALHLRGACLEPLWHALRPVWLGEGALHRRHPALRASDVPIAEGRNGDQFVLRDHAVLRLRAQTGELDDLQLRLGGFVRLAESDPLDQLGVAR